MSRKYSYDAVKNSIAGEYENISYPSGSGVERKKLNALIREVYEAGEKAKRPFALTRAEMLRTELENVRCAVNCDDPFANILERQLLSTASRGGVPPVKGAIREIQGERKAYYSAVAENGIAVPPWQVSCAQVDTSHSSPHWDNIITLGVPGLLARAEKCFAEKPSPFTESVKIACTAVRDFLLRYGKVARSSGAADVAAMLVFLADEPPQTLRQALQLGLIFREVLEIEGEWVRSMGIFDRIYRPFYERDIASGELTCEDADELLAIYFARFSAQSQGMDAGTPFCFGGYLPGKESADGCCELTRAAWRAFRRTGAVDPKFSLRVNPDTPQDILASISECIKEGKNAVVFVNEATARKSFLKNGKSEEDLCNFIPIGCYEPAIMGKELSCSMNGTINMASFAEMLWQEPGFEPENISEVEELYLKLLSDALDKLMELINRKEKLWHLVNPAPLLSGTMDECMARSRDVSEGGTKYATSGIMCAGAGTAADVISAIRYLVFEQKLISYRDLGELLARNWEGNEFLRLKAKNCAPKWGGGDKTADDFAIRLCRVAAEKISSTANAKGGKFQMGLWSIDYSITYGNRMGATADGRKAGDPISKNSGSSIGCEREGTAGLLESVSKLDHSSFANGSVLDVMLLSSTVNGEEGTSFICSLVRSFFARGGGAIHFNILSAKELREAQISPEKYRNLQVRLCGWNVRFIDLDKKAQDCLIREAESREY